MILNENDLALKARITKLLQFMNLSKLSKLSKACSVVTLIKMRDKPDKKIGFAPYKALEVFFKQEFKDL